ncbi:MAG: EFR1 family ferrodoxin [Victivallales bacterium]
MKTLLYYFSGTGNTLMLARLLAKELEDVEIINIAGCQNSSTAPQADRIGILFPVYAFGPPRMVTDFLKNLQPPEGAYIFSMVNYANAGGPAALKIAKAILNENGIKLNAGFGVAMPSNYIPFGGAENQEKQNKKFIAAAEEVNRAGKIIKKAPESYFYKQGFVPLFFARFCNRMLVKRCSKDAAKFYVNDNCTSCGTCVKICPVRNVKLVDKRPAWGNNCEQCMACLQWCPENAIQVKGVPGTRSHYQNPAVTAQELIEDMQRQP